MGVIYSRIVRGRRANGCKTSMAQRVSREGRRVQREADPPGQEPEAP